MGQIYMRHDMADTALASYLRERSELLALARSVVGRADIAEDIVQDSWIRWDRHDYPADRAKPIFRKIVANLARDWLRKASREHDRVATATHAAEAEPDTERTVIARQELRTVIKALRKLPQRTFLAFKMRRLEGLTYEEIGARLGVNASRAYQLSTKALARIAMELDG